MSRSLPPAGSPIGQGIERSSLMTTKYWVKLYIEILHDPKMGLLPDPLWRRAIEMFLLAGKAGNNDGILPRAGEIAWTLHLPEEQVVADLKSLAEVGIVHEAEPGVWHVTNFKERQSVVPVNERVRRHRSCNDDVTKRYKECNEAVAVPSVSTSTSDSLSVSDSEGEERVQGEERVPTTPAEAILQGDIRVFSQVTDGRIPGLSQYKAVIDAIRTLREKIRLDDQALIGYLRPFWQSWSGRKRLDGVPYDPGKITWLTDWALNGSMPMGKKEDPGVKTKVDQWMNKGG